jgi:hypothetical protein
MTRIRRGPINWFDTLRSRARPALVGSLSCCVPICAARVRAHERKTNHAWARHSNLGSRKVPLCGTPSRNYIGTGIQPPPLNQYRTAQTLTYPRQGSAQTGNGKAHRAQFPLNSVSKDFESWASFLAKETLFAGNGRRLPRDKAGICELPTCLARHPQRQHQNDTLPDLNSRRRLWQPRNTD